MIFKFVIRWAVLFVGVLFGIAAPASAQEFGRVEEITATGVPYSVFVRLGEPAIQVSVAGSPGAGLYEVGVSTDLSRMLVLSGAATSDTKAKVELRRLEGGISRVIYKGRVKDVLSEPGRAPALQEGDVLVISMPRGRFGWRDGLQIVSGLSSVVVLVWNIARVF